MTKHETILSCISVIFALMIATLFITQYRQEERLNSLSKMQSNTIDAQIKMAQIMVYLNKEIEKSK